MIHICFIDTFMSDTRFLFVNKQKKKKEMNSVIMGQHHYKCIKYCLNMYDLYKYSVSLNDCKFFCKKEFTIMPLWLYLLSPGTFFLSKE